MAAARDLGERRVSEGVWCGSKLIMGVAASWCSWRVGDSDGARLQQLPCQD